LKDNWLTEMKQPGTLLRAAYTNALSDVVMSVIGLAISGSAVFRWIQGFDVQATHASLVGVIVAYFYSRNHLTALNTMLRTQGDPDKPPERT